MLLYWREPQYEMSNVVEMLGSPLACAPPNAGLLVMDRQKGWPTGPLFTLPSTCI